MSIPRWFWEEPHRLECNSDWRITTRPADGVCYHSDGRHLQALIFGREEHLQRPHRVGEILRTIEERLGLDREEWRWQSPFYGQFIRSFFQATSAPGWIKIANSRLSFRERVGVIRGNAEHFGHSSRRLYRAKFLGHESLPFHDTVLPTTYLRMKYRSGIPQSDLNVYEVTIFRTLEGDGLGGPLTCHENWLHLGSGDREERKARRLGVNLALREYPQADPLGRMTPLVSFCRMTEDRKWVISRCVSLCPGTGEAIDFRSVVHRTEFYFRSDLSNMSMLSQAVTPGQFERFVNG